MAARHPASNRIRVTKPTGETRPGDTRSFLDRVRWKRMGVGYHAQDPNRRNGSAAIDRDGRNWVVRRFNRDGFMFETIKTDGNGDPIRTLKLAKGFAIDSLYSEG